MPTANTQSIESFNLSLEPFESVLQAEKPIQYAERRILEQLPQAVRLLRWAIVKVEAQNTEGALEGRQATTRRYWCEGAYLKTFT